MSETEKIYIAIDLKSFYASVECVDRGLDPINTNLVVADPTRTRGTICLAVSPALKAIGVPGRPRLFETYQVVQKANRERLLRNHLKSFSGKSFYAHELSLNPKLAIDFITAPPRMARYMECSTIIYNIYQKFVSKDDINVYSIDEVFMEVSSYLNLYKTTPEELCIRILKEVYSSTGLTATAGIGTNMYLAKIAMDVLAKKMEPNEFGVRMASLNEKTYRLYMWNHTPLSDFWSVGPGIEKRLVRMGIYTMGDLAERALVDEDSLFREFGVRAEFLIDHAFGIETATIPDIKKIYRQRKSMSQGQVLPCSYTNTDAKIVIVEMTEQLCLDLICEHLTCHKLVMDVGYDIDNFKNCSQSELAAAGAVLDHYGRYIPKPAHGTITLPCYSSAFSVLRTQCLKLFERISNPAYNIRRLRVAAIDLMDESEAESALRKSAEPVQLDLFEAFNLDGEKKEKKEETPDAQKLKKESLAQKAMIKIKSRYGKNAILKGNNFEKGATARLRNRQVGGHNA